MTGNGNQETQSQPLGMWDCISIIIGIVIGTSIFYLPGLILLQVPNPWMGLAVWLFGGFLAFMGGLCYAELATTYPRSGGDYVYLSRSFGPGTGFLFGWAQLVVVMPTSIGIMALVFGQILGDFYKLEEQFHFGLGSDFMYATAAVAVLTVLNILGVTMGKITQNLLSLAKVVGLIAIVVVAFAWGGDKATDWTFPSQNYDKPLPPQDSFPAGPFWGWQVLAIILVLYAYGGWNDAAFVAAEVRDRERNIPRALLFGIGAITLIYVLVNLAYVYALGFSGARLYPSQGVLPSMVMTKAFDETGGTIMNVIIMASALGAVTGLIFTGSRIYATLGQDHKLFGFLGHWQPGKPPVLALILQSAVTVGLLYLITTQQGHETINTALAATQDFINGLLQRVNDDLHFNMDFQRQWRPNDAFTELFSHSAPAFWLFFLLAGFSLFKLRELDPGRERPFTVPCYPLVPFIFCCMCLYMLYRSTIYIEERIVFVIVLLAVGVPLYGFSRLIGGRPPEHAD